ncbi:aminotransferase class III-fold pyridoxal phosphate-dependent enzyme [Mycobacterium lepromatosis]|nr:aminotransferase class III-fold pyridoxal phosphate-dependent enzyme [Mycobacterium lepromatosis]
MSFDDTAASAEAIDDNTIVVRLEPLLGEADIIVPPDDYLLAVQALGSEHNVLMIADKIQSSWPAPAIFLCVTPWGRSIDSLSAW